MNMDNLFRVFIIMYQMNGLDWIKNVKRRNHSFFSRFIVYCTTDYILCQGYRSGTVFRIRSDPVSDPYFLKSRKDHYTIIDIYEKKSECFLVIIARKYLQIHFF